MNKLTPIQYGIQALLNWRDKDKTFVSATPGPDKDKARSDRLKAEQSMRTAADKINEAASSQQKREEDES